MRDILPGGGGVVAGTGTTTTFGSAATDERRTGVSTSRVDADAMVDDGDGDGRLDMRLG